MSHKLQIFRNNYSKKQWLIIAIITFTCLLYIESKSLQKNPKKREKGEYDIPMILTSMILMVCLLLIFTRSFIVKLILQLSFVFIALTILFYNYVILIEKEETGKQLAIIVNRLNDIYKKEIPDIDNPQLKIHIRSLLEGIKQKKFTELQSTTKNIDDMNSKIVKTSMNLVYASVVLVGLIVIYGLFLFYKKDKDTHIGDELYLATIAIIAIVVTEIFFLNVISKHYISADPNFIVIEVCETLKSMKE